MEVNSDQLYRQEHEKTQTRFPIQTLKTTERDALMEWKMTTQTNRKRNISNHCQRLKQDELKDTRPPSRETCVCEENRSWRWTKATKERGKTAALLSSVSPPVSPELLCQLRITGWSNMAQASPGRPGPAQVGLFPGGIHAAKKRRLKGNERHPDDLSAQRFVRKRINCFLTWWRNLPSRTLQYRIQSEPDWRDWRGQQLPVPEGSHEGRTAPPPGVCNLQR